MNVQCVISILSNTNRFVVSSDDALSSVRENSMVRFQNQEVFYTIANVKQFYYIQDCSIAGTIVNVKENSNINLIEGDCVEISYKEYELLTVINPKEKGQNYKIGEVLTLVGGVLSKDTGIIQPTTFRVTQVDDKGGIIQVFLETPGKYIKTPEKIAYVQGGSGTNAVFNVEYRLLDKRALVERTILKISHESAATQLILDSPLPNGVEQGKLSVEKWEAFLTSNYVGDSILAGKAQILRDFSPNLGIPYLLRGNPHPENIYNLTINTLDKKIGELEKRIFDLENKRG